MTILSLADHPEWAERATTWFHEKWQVPREVYAESIALSLAGATARPSACISAIWRTDVFPTT